MTVTVIDYVKKVTLLCLSKGPKWKCKGLRTESRTLKLCMSSVYFFLVLLCR